MLESLIIGCTSKCQLKCRMCANKSFPQITIETYREIIEWAHGQYKEVIPDGNGEPLLHPDIAEMTKLAPTSIVTNGELLSKEMFDRLSLTEVRISLDGSDAAAHERIRVGGNFQRVVQNIDYAARRIPVMVFSVLTKENSESLMGMPKLLNDLGVKKWAVWDCQDYGNELGRKDGLQALGGSYKGYLKAMAQGKVGLALHDGGEAHKCEAPQKQMYVHSNGDLSVCCIADDYVFGNFRDMTFEEAREKELSINLHEMGGRHLKCRDWLGYENPIV